MSKRQILIVEDDREMAETLSEIFTFEGFIAEMAFDGQQALDLLADHLPDIIVLDMHLPQVSGVEVLHRIRADEQMAALPVLVITADATLARSMEPIADAVLVKPASIMDMVALCNQLLE